jgi:hypothetical protein
MAYFSNGSSGMVFDEQCGRCRYGDQPCPIYLVQVEFNYEACNNEVASKILGALVKNDGTCAMFKLDPQWFDKDRIPPSEADAAYYSMTQETPEPIRELILKSCGRVA